MIQPLQSNSINFKGVELSPALKARVETQNANQNNAVMQEEPKKEFSITETYNKGKKTVVDFFKGLNNVSGVTGGIVKGVAEGAGVTAIVGVVGKAVSEARKETGLKVVGHIIGKSISDFATGAWNTVKFIPSIITKSPLENLKTISSLPKKFFANEYVKDGKNIKGYLSGHKTVAGIAVAVGLGVLALRTLQGKVNANEKNADLDHKTNLGHV